MIDKQDVIVSLLRLIDKNIENIGIGVDPNDTIPLEIPPKDSVYYRTYINNAVYWDLGSGSSGTSGESGVDILNQWINGSGTVTINDLKEILGNSPSAQVGVINELITEIALPDDITYLPYISPNLKKVYANNIEDVNAQNKQSLLAQLSEDGPLKCGKVLFGWKGEIPEVITTNVTEGITSISEGCFADSKVSVVELSDSVEKVGRKAFYNTPFIQTFLDQPIYFGKTLYDITGTFTADTFGIPEGIKYINMLGLNVMPYQSGSTGYDPSGDAGVGDTETREFFNVSINRINIPSTVILTNYPFEGVQNLTYLGFPQTLPTISEYWLSGSTEGVMQAYYDGTIQLFKDLLLITGSEWIDNSSIIVVYCTDGEYWLEDVEFLKYTTVDGSTLPGSFDYGNLIYGDSSFDMNSISNAGGIETLILPSCVLNMYNILGWHNIKSIDLSKTYIYDLGNGNVYDNHNLETLVLPYNNFLLLNRRSLFTCYNLSNVYYNGTVEEFNNISKDSQWFYCTPFDYVICSDGKVLVASIIKYTTSDDASCASFNYVYDYHYDGQGICCLSDNTIPNNLFNGCNTLTSVEIPDYITSIGDEAFSYCSALTSVTINSDAIVNKSYQGNSSISDIFGTQVTEYIIGNSVTKIGYQVFHGCSSLASVTIGNSVTNIGASAFYNCSSLASITISDNVKNIGSSAFQNCESLTSITIPNSVTSIGAYAFSGCSSLASITIPESVTDMSIGETFEGCTALESVQWNASNCTLNPHEHTGYHPPFNNLSSITRFTFGSNVQSIPTYLCSRLSGLTEIISLNPVPPTIASSTFIDIDKSIPLYVPDVEAYLNAEYWNEFTNILPIS